MPQELSKVMVAIPAEAIEPSFAVHICTGVRIANSSDERVFVIEECFFVRASSLEVAREFANDVVARKKRRGLLLPLVHGPNIELLGEAVLVDIGVRRIISCSDDEIDGLPVRELTYQKMIVANSIDFDALLRNRDNDVNLVGLYE